MKLRRICVCTSYPALTEPRARRHALAIAGAMSQCEIVFVDCVPSGTTQVDAAFSDLKIHRLTHRYPHRNHRAHLHARNRVQTSIGKLLARMGGVVLPAAFGPYVCGLAQLLNSTKADLFFAHNIECLLPAAIAAKCLNAKLMFDSMEYYSDMASSQSDFERNLVRRVERAYLPQCDLVTTSSEELSTELATMYGIKRPLALYNVPPIEYSLQKRSSSGLSLYWRNSTIGLGERGLEDVLVALTSLPEDIVLSLQGGVQADGGASVQALISQLGLKSRVEILPPYSPPNAVKEAAKHAVGLCLERRSNRNHELTVSNKMFDYHMAGLVTIASDLPGLRSVIERSQGGLLYESGSPASLARRILDLYENRELLRVLSTNAREFAVREGNLSLEMDKFTKAFLGVFN